MKTLSCGIGDLVPWPRIEPGHPSLGGQSLRHWMVSPKNTQGTYVTKLVCTSQLVHTITLYVYNDLNGK